MTAGRGLPLILWVLLVVVVALGHALVRAVLGQPERVEGALWVARVGTASVLFWILFNLDWS